MSLTIIITIIIIITIVMCPESQYVSVVDKIQSATYLFNLLFTWRTHAPLSTVKKIVWFNQLKNMVSSLLSFFSRVSIVPGTIVI